MFYATTPHLLNTIWNIEPFLLVISVKLIYTNGAYPLNSTLINTMFGSACKYIIYNHVASQDGEATRFVASSPPSVSPSFPDLLVHDGGGLLTAETCCFCSSHCYCKGFSFGACRCCLIMCLFDGLLGLKRSFTCLFLQQWVVDGCISYCVGGRFHSSFLKGWVCFFILSLVFSENIYLLRCGQAPQAFN
jgi:hypothetical protein